MEGSAMSTARRSGLSWFLAPARCLAAAAACWLALLPGPASGEWLVDAALGVQIDDNLPLAQDSNDIEGDAALVGSVSVGRRVYPTDALSLTLSADVDGARQAEYRGLSRTRAGASAAAHLKLGLGPRAPWIGAAFGVLRADFVDPKRDGWHSRASASAGRRLAESWSVSGGYDFERRRSDDIFDIPGLVTNFGLRGDAWDTDRHRISARVVYAPTERFALVAHYARLWGDVVATTRISGPVFAVSDAVARDPDFGPDRFAYRLEADIDVYGLAASWALGDHSAVDIGLERRFARGKRAVRYESTVLSANLRVRY
jgi:hypothetical protein